MSSFEFPKNIKQIGTIEDGMKIYIEDYVCTYLSQYAEGSGYDERLAFLVGRSMVIDGQTVLFISGCIQSMYCVYEKGIVSFSDKSWIFAKEQMRRYFSDLHIVGWMQSQPGYGIHLNSNCVSYHTNNFIQNDHVLFVTDPIEKVNAFYVWNEQCDGLVESKGYFIYYEKNRNMHEYMLEHKVSGKARTVDIPAAKEEPKKTTRGKEQNTLSAKRGLESKQTVGERLTDNHSILEKRGDTEKRMETEEYYRPIIKERQTVRAAKYTHTQQKRAVNLLVTFSAVLVIICFIMGAGLLRNDNRISTLERQLTQLNTAYRDLLLQIPDGKTTSVFAAENMDDDDYESANVSPTEVPVATIVPTPRPTMTPEPTPDPTPKPTPVPTSTPGATPSPTPEAVITPQPTIAPFEAEEMDAPSGSQVEQDRETASTPAENSEAEAESFVYDLEEIPETYIVQKGDNLSYISQRFYGNRSMVNEIMEINGITDPNKLYYGRELKLPR